MRALVLAAVACSTESGPPAPVPAAATVATADAAGLADAAVDAPPAAWSFAVLSDLHLPNPRASEVTRVVRALIELKVRFVVITGDHTNGNGDDPRRTYADAGWDAVTQALTPLRDAGIAVLPVAGNHDSYLSWQRDHYAAAFRDLARWAAPLVVTPQSSHGHGRAPFSYSVTVDGVHLSLVHLVAQSVEPEVATWLAADLEAAAGARHRIVAGHVPLSSVFSTSHAAYLAQLGGLLERGRATLHIGGHEHLVWDEDVALPAGGTLRQVLVGCSSGFYQYEPRDPAKQRAHCAPVADRTRKEPMRCAMPHGGGLFEIARGRKNRHVQHARTTFTVLTVTGDAISVQPMTLDAAGRAIAFYLDP